MVIKAEAAHGALCSIHSGRINTVRAGDVKSTVEHEPETIMWQKEWNIKKGSCTKKPNVRVNGRSGEAKWETADAAAPPAKNKHWIFDAEITTAALIEKTPGQGEAHTQHFWWDTQFKQQWRCGFLWLFKRREQLHAQLLVRIQKLLR